MNKIEWTDAHRREAREALVIETFRMMRGLTGDLDYEVRQSAAHDVSTEANFCEYMAELGLDPARIDREVRRVRGLADGRIVREQSVRHEVRDSRVAKVFQCSNEENGKNEASEHNGRYVRIRVTHIRKDTHA